MEGSTWQLRGAVKVTAAGCCDCLGVVVRIWFKLLTLELILSATWKISSQMQNLTLFISRHQFQFDRISVLKESRLSLPVWCKNAAA